MVMGRPGHDRVKIAKEMLEWAKLDTSVNLNGFTAVSGIVPRNILRWSKEDDDFCRTYDEVKSILGERRERYLTSGTLHVKAYDLNAKVYDAYLKDESRDEKVFEASLKAGEGEEINEEIKTKQDQILSQISSLQESSRLAKEEAREASKSIKVSNNINNDK